MLAEKNYQELCKYYNLFPYSPEERREGIKNLKLMLKKNNYKLNGFCNYHNTMDDVHSKKVTIQYIDYGKTRKDNRIRSLSPLHLIALGVNIVHLVKKPYCNEHYFYVSIIGTNRIHVVLDVLNRELFEGKSILQKYF